ncbi:MAG TPA: cytochrome c oxidase accessory protein CcoG [Chryseosolibacter sp.]|nr:cytochrome c oxidase accessory protein CcoG [Chryseosolibacter sp.]
MESGVKIDILKNRTGKTAKPMSETDEDNTFRASIATVDEKGRRVWVYPKKPSGMYHNARIGVTVLLLSLLFAGPFVKIGGQPLLLLNVFERRFIVFGQAFWPQDFVLLAVSLLVFFVFIILFTVVFGRVWCGWMCPQTLFMEMVFRKVEYLIEGDMAAQRRLAKAPWTFDKIKKKTLKHAVFVAISLLIAHTLMAYMVGVEQTMTLVNGPPTAHLGTFSGVIGFTGVFYWLFAFFREQACIAVCPYGRLQGVLLGKESIVVAYDWLRGEPRGHKKKNVIEAVPQGDCIDCNLCVQVCPTGIDIRNGTQMECVNCTACMDACDDVMIKIGKPKGLIRFASHNSIVKGVQRLWNGRVLGYSAVLLLLLGGLSFALATRSDVETTFLKVSGTLYQREPGLITNLYNAEFVNKTFDDVALEARVESPSYAQLTNVNGKPVIVPAEGLMKSVYFIKIPEDQVTSARTVVVIGIYQNGHKVEDLKVKFIGPVTSASTVNLKR